MVIKIINGQPRIYTGALHRILMYEAFAPALAQAGWFGYGPRWDTFVLRKYAIDWCLLVRR